jgi:hypothetical protein
MVAGLGWINGIGVISMKLARTRRIVMATLKPEAKVTAP